MICIDFLTPLCKLYFRRKRFVLISRSFNLYAGSFAKMFNELLDLL